VTSKKPWISNDGDGGGSAGFHVVVVVVSAARAIDANDVIAKLNAAPTQAAANFLEFMTLPLFYPCCPIRLPDLMHRRAKCSFHATWVRGSTAEPITATVGVGSTQSSPDCVLVFRKSCANRPQARRGCRKSVTSTENGERFH